MYNKFKEVFNGITNETINAWIEDLIFVKTYLGLKIQDEIFKNISSEFGLEYLISDPISESKGIDGFLDGMPFSVKPETYDTKINKNIETIFCPIIKYKIVKNSNTNNTIYKITFPIELRNMIH